MLRSLLVMPHEEDVFDPRNALGFQIELSDEKYPVENRRIFFDQLLSRLRTLPGVAAAGAIHLLPMTGTHKANFTIVGGPPVEKGKEPYTNFCVLTPGYFGAIGMPLKRGRDFNAQDNEKASEVV